MSVAIGLVFMVDHETSLHPESLHAIIDERKSAAYALGLDFETPRLSLTLSFIYAESDLLLLHRSTAEVS